MKQCVKCANCDHVMRKSACYRIQLEEFGLVSTMFQPPEYKNSVRKAYLCKGCAPLSGYTVKRERKEKNTYVAEADATISKKTN